MRNLRLLDAYRISGKALWGWDGDETCGAFVVKSPVDRGDLRIIASAGEGWDHVSVSRTNRCPNWPEMEHVKRMFFRDHETAMQLHVPPPGSPVAPSVLPSHLATPDRGNTSAAGVDGGAGNSGRTAVRLHESDKSLTVTMRSAAVHDRRLVTI